MLMNFCSFASLEMRSFAHIPITSRATSLEAVFVVQEEKHMLLPSHRSKIPGPSCSKAD